MPDTKFVKSQSDRISELPDDILSCIVSYLSVKDASNTSLVSKRWRHLCSSMSELIFDVNTMFGLHLNLNQSYLDGIHACPNCKYIFIQGVNQFLQFHKGSQLLVFQVSFCLDEDSTSDIDQWVSFAVSRGVQELYLCLSCPIKTSFGRRLYTLPSEVLSHPNAAKMRTFFLNSCILEPGAMNHLGGLQYLTLGYLPLGEEGLENIVSSCLNLKRLTFINVTLPPKLCISGSLQRLEFLAVLHCLGLGEIELSATNLTTFEYAGHFIKFCFSRVPKLEKVFFNARDGEGLHYVFTHLAKDLPLLKYLSVYSKLNWGQYLPKDIATFSNVKHLQLLCDPLAKLDVLRFIIILRACPLLENLSIMINFPVHLEEGANLSIKFSHQHLKEVHIGGFQCLTSYIDFAKCMLESAAALEKMVIDPELVFYIGDYRWVHRDGTWGKGDRRKVCKWLKDHTRRAAIIVK